MSLDETTPSAPDAVPSTATSDFGLDSGSKPLSEALVDYVRRLRSGDVGSLPGIIAFVALCALFTFSRKSFLTDINIANLTQQAAWLAVLAMGVTFVLLLGEIDLSAGAAMGVTVAYVYTRTNSGLGDIPTILLCLIIGAAVGLVVMRQTSAGGMARRSATMTGAGVGLVVFGLLVLFAPGTMIAILLGMVVGTVMGTFAGFLVARVGIPSFVVTLALFLAWQGWLLKLAKEGGSINVQDEFLVAIGTKSMSTTLGWILFVAVVLGFLGFSFNQRRGRLSKGASAQSGSVIVAKTIGIAVLWVFFTWRMNQNRAFAAATKPLTGVPYVVPVILLLVVIPHLLAQSHGMGPPSVRRGRQPGGRSSCGYQRSEHPHVGVRSGGAVGSGRRHHLRIPRRFGHPADRLPAASC